MPQLFKTIYFPDHPAETPQRRNVKIAFGPNDDALYRTIKPLSSQQVRELLGYASFAALQSDAAAGQRTLNGFCVHRLRERIGNGRRRAQRYLPGLKPDAPMIDPAQATFRGGKDEPLHEWYPYLEGYSPDFVEHVLREFAPTANHVLDPFSGTGTTPLTVAGLGRRASYCELNPLLQFLVQAKITAFNLPLLERNRVIAELRRLAAGLGRRIAASPPDAMLGGHFDRAFGKSRFFDPSTFEAVLRLRTMLDDVACRDLTVAQLATVAVLGSLVSGSLLIRRGDVRFKTEAELKRQPPAMLRAVADRLGLIADDLGCIHPLSSTPRLLCADARELATLPCADVDAVITSPPYLNGTNYFRNTKVELWFLRCLTAPEDLARFRRQTVTAGINDVTKDKPSGSSTDSVAEVVRQLKSHAYDARIPRMVQTYFHDMSTVFDGLAGHLCGGALVLIDIGDSSYGGVRVETPSLLAGILQQRGFSLLHHVVLRRRMSRGGDTLSQVLLVLQAPSQAAAPAPIAHKRGWQARWRRFKRVLPHQLGLQAKRNWGHPLHSLCSYQGKMKPSLASELVRTFVPEGGKVLDPFGGVGTIPFEAAMQGVTAWSFDISPAAVHITRAKLQPADPGSCRDLMDRLAAFLETETVSPAELDEASAIRFNGTLAEYFHLRTFREILLARRFFRLHQPSSSAASLVLASLLHILHGNRPYALSRRSHPITPFAPTGRREYRGLVGRLREKVERSLSVPVPSGFVSGQSLCQDATAIWPHEIQDLDAVITSPPFYDSTRFYLANWMRLWFCGWNATDFKQRPLAFVDERQKRSFEVYQPIFRQARERLRPGGVMVLHLGKSRKCDMAHELKGIARPWFRIADVFAERVDHCESHGIRDKGTVVEHSYVVLE